MEKECVNCKQFFKTKRNEEQKTCSRSCNATYKNRNRKFECPRCKVCGKPTRRESRAVFCSRTCQGIGQTAEHNPMWNGGVKLHSSGYVMLLMKGHHEADTNGYIFEHRYVMEQHLKRRLAPNEIVHHKNGIKIDNRLDNLQVMTQAEHVFETGHLNNR